jgi:RNA polymerase sigma factor (sigma-70 family)
MSTGRSAGPEQPDLDALLPIVRRVIGARVSDPVLAEDLVQEAVVRVLTAADRVEPGMLEPYAITTARNLVATTRRDQDRERRNQHRALDLSEPDVPDEDLVAREDRTAMAQALSRLSPEDQETVLEHEVSGKDMRTLAEETGSTAGAVAARLNRTRARLRVEYLLALDGTEPPSDRCRTVLLALSSGDRRRRRDADVDRHLLGCPLCRRLSEPLLDRSESSDDEVHVPVRSDDDVVAARRTARDLAARLGFPRTDVTVISTAVTEVAGNILRFAGCGDVLVERVDQPRSGLRIVARDTGPGIPDVDQALTEGYSSGEGLGLGLPGVRQLMDEVTVVSEGRGTTVTMTKWCPAPG